RRPVVPGLGLIQVECVELEAHGGLPPRLLEEVEHRVAVLAAGDGDEDAVPGTEERMLVDRLRDGPGEIGAKALRRLRLARRAMPFREDREEIERHRQYALAKWTRRFEGLSQRTHVPASSGWSNVSTRTVAFVSSWIATSQAVSPHQGARTKPPVSS